MKTMLKIFSVFVALVAFCVSCTNDIVSDETKSSSFDNELASYVAAQKAILNKRKAQTRAGGHLSFEDLVAMACEIDSTSRAFYDEHPELIAQINEKITLDDIEIMKMDADSLQAFVDRNFSKDICKIVDANINGNEFKDNDILLPRAGETEVDKTLKANLEVSQEFNEIVTGSLQPPVMKASQSYCAGQYNNRIGGCKASYYRNVTLTTICTALFAPTGVGAAAVATLSYGLAMYEYQNCLDDAHRSYVDCLK